MQSFAFSLCGLFLLGACSPALAQVPAAPPPAVPVAPARVETPDFAGAIWEPASPQNFQPSDRPSAERPIDRIVIHDIEGTAISAVRWFQNPQAQASSHYVVGANGTVYQMIKERDIAWHAGDRPTNFRSIGIEHEGFAYRPGFFTSVEYDTSARLVRQIALRYNIPRDREHIIGHFEVPDSAHPGHFGGRSGHTDPGPYWDWDNFLARVRSDASRASGSVLTATLRPGETQAMTVSLINTGDDPWPADLKAAPDRDLRQNGPVYLGTASGQPSPFYGPGWVSPSFVMSATGGDVAPGSSGQFVIPLRAPQVAPEPPVLDALAEDDGHLENFRLFKVPVAPRTPLGFGPVITVQVKIVPWNLAASAPQVAPRGWAAKETADGKRVVWRKVTTKDASSPVRYQVTLPLDGYYEVWFRTPPGPRKAHRVTYRITGADGVKTFTPIQAGMEAWDRIGRVRFAAPPQTGAGVRPGQLAPAAPPVVATIELLPTAQAGDILTASDIALNGPFPPPSDTGTPKK